MGVKKIVHKGTTIVFTDYRGLATAEQQIQLLEELIATLKMSPTSLLILSNFEGIRIGPEFLDRGKAMGIEYQSKIKRQAFIGVTGIKKVIFQGFVTFTGAKEIRAFDSEAEAMDWLVI